MAWTLGSEHIVTIESLDFDGLGNGVSESGKKVKVLNALPGETVRAQVMKRRRGTVLTVATEVLDASPMRQDPQDVAFLSGALWDIMSVDSENTLKQQALEAFLAKWNVQHPEIVSDGRAERYRNKAEFSIYGDIETGKVSLAFHRRGTKRGKIPVTDSILIPQPVVNMAQNIIDGMNERGIGRDALKVIQGRYSFSTQTVTGYVFVTNPEVDFAWVEEYLNDEVVGLEVIYSNPKSPAAVITTKLHTFGQTEVTEKLLDQEFVYPGHGFFQVNPPMFEKALADIREYVKEIAPQGKVLDLYAGVGVIGLTCAPYVGEMIGVELFQESRTYALRNAESLGILNYSFVEAAVETQPEILQGAEMVILDPPRAGIHPKAMKALLEHQPEYIVYLSCNPKTQRMDMDQLLEVYQITKTQAYNFYPKTPHMEHLVCLRKKNEVNISDVKR